MISPETLRRFPLFSGLDPGMLKKLAMISEEVAFKTGEWFFHEGDEAESLFLILRGMIDLRIVVSDENEHRNDLTTLVEGEVMGWSALVEPHIYRLSAIAIADTHVIRMDGIRLRELMEENPEVGYLLMSRLAGAIGTRLNNMRVRLISLTEA